MSKFTDFGLATPILEALAAERYEIPTPIQAQAIPHVMAGRDLLGLAQTGTGKTAAFALPILHRFSADSRARERRACRALVLSPTRELASQIAESFRVYGRHLPLTVAAVYGGVPIRPQMRALERGVDVLVATPGRLIDHLEQRTVRLDRIEVLVLDEADHMLDMGFIEPIRRIVRTLPAKRQNLFFSATMPRQIGELADELLHDPVKVAVAPAATTVELVDQRVILVEGAGKRALLAKILRDDSFRRTLVFTRTKHGADRVVRQLGEAGIAAAAIHGNKGQGQRERALAAFRSGATRVLVATDIAARGIDVDGISHVVNYDLPNVAETYVHRIGRTARAGASGIAISLCDAEETAFLRDIEKLIRAAIPATNRRGAVVRKVHSRTEEARHRTEPRRGGRVSTPTAPRGPQSHAQRPRPQPQRQPDDLSGVVFLNRAAKTPRYPRPHR